MKMVRAIVLAAAAAMLLSSCATTRDIPAPVEKMEISKDVSVGIRSLTDEVNSISYNGKSYSPTKGDSTILQVNIAVTNNSDREYDLLSMQNLELICVSPDKKMTYIPWTKPFDYFAGASLFGAQETKKNRKVVGVNASLNDTVYFIHDKKIKPVALSASRNNTLYLINQADLDFPEAQAFVAKNAAIQNAFNMAAHLDYDALKRYMSDNNVGIGDTNWQGLTLLYAGILANNQSVIDGCIKDGADLYARTNYEFYTVLPMHLAVLSCNKKAVASLQKAGVDIRVKDKNIEEPAAIAIKENNVAAARMLKEMGVDLSSVQIEMAWSKSKPAYNYAKDRGLTEMLDILSN